MEMRPGKALTMFGSEFAQQDKGRFYWAILIVARTDVPITLSWHSIVMEKRVSSGHAVHNVGYCSPCLVQSDPNMVRSAH